MNVYVCENRSFYGEYNNNIAMYIANLSGIGCHDSTILHTDLIQG